MIYVHVQKNKSLEVCGYKNPFTGKPIDEMIIAFVVHGNHFTNKFFYENPMYKNSISIVFFSADVLQIPPTQTFFYLESECTFIAFCIRIASAVDNLFPNI